MERWIGDGELPAGGRAPLGFEWRDGELVPGDDFDQVRVVLTAAADLSSDLSHSRAADRLDTSLRTVSRAIEERASMYGLEEVDE